MIDREQALPRNLFAIPYHLFVELAGHRGVPLRHRAPKLVLPRRSAKRVSGLAGHLRLSGADGTLRHVPQVPSVPLVPLVSLVSQ